VDILVFVVEQVSLFGHFPEQTEDNHEIYQPNNLCLG